MFKKKEVGREKSYGWGCGQGLWRQDGLEEDLHLSKEGGGTHTSQD